MQAPQFPKNEEERLRELLDYGVLDTSREEDFDDLTLLASQICDTPVSLITFVDTERQWFKSAVGIDINETPRDVSFCGHAILDPDSILEVKDARADERLKDNPLVTGELQVGFYVGVPLVTENGNALGTLCVIDSKARNLTKKQKNALKVLAKQAMHLLALRKRSRQLDELVNFLTAKNAKIEKFAYTAAHDLQSPLNNISQMVNLLKSKEDLPPKVFENSLNHISTLSDKLRNLITDLLSFSKVNNLTELPREEIDLVTFYADIQQLLPDFQKVQFDHNFICPKLNVNKPVLHFTLLNLFTNAIKYCDKENVLVQFNQFQSEGKNVFQVIDNGSGIPEGYKPKLFEAFETAGKKDRFGNIGSGLGLANIKRILTELGGDIYLVKSSKEGSIFEFYMPLEMLC